MLGSHNTFTYLKTNNIFSKWSKCQEINYRKQYTLGVRCFDVRIKFDKKGDLKLVHNCTIYKGGYEDLLHFLQFLSNKGDCYIRLILDIRKEPSDKNHQIKWFKDIIALIKTLNIKIVEALTYWDWQYYEQDKSIKITEKHASVTNIWEVIKTPKNYAKKHNPEIRKENKNIIDSNTEILLIDFVNE